MIEIKGDLWADHGERVVRCITTNGATRKDGSAIMGRGCALEASQRCRGLQQKLGRHLKVKGNIMAVFMSDYGIVTFPVKRHWAEEADPKLIATSAKHLKSLAGMFPGHTFLLPRPGCGNGRLDWFDVKPLLKDLPDNVWVISREGE